MSEQIDYRRDPVQGGTFWACWWKDGRLKACLNASEGPRYPEQEVRKFAERAASLAKVPFVGRGEDF